MDNESSCCSIASSIASSIDPGHGYTGVQNSAVVSNVADTMNRVSNVVSEFLFEECAKLQELKKSKRVTIRDVVQNVKNVWEGDENMLLDTENLPPEVQSWKEPGTNLNLLQLAILHGRVKVVKHWRNKYNFHYETKVCTVAYNLPWETKKRKAMKPVIVNAPLHLACKLANLDMIKLLLSHPTCSDMLDERSALQLQNKMAVSAKQRRINAKTAFEICLEEGHLECCIYIAEKLFRHKIQGRCTDGLYCVSSFRPMLGDPLHTACHLKYVPYLNFLLSKDYFKKQINVKDNSYKPPLWISLKDKDCTQVLLQHGANVNTITDGKSLLQSLLVDKEWMRYKKDRDNTFETASLLLKHKINVNRVNRLAPCSGRSAVEELLCTSFGDGTSFFITRKISKLKAEALYKFLTLLLDNGATTTVTKAKYSSIVERTVAKKFLDRFVSKGSATKNINVIYSVLKILFERGALDPNLTPDNQNPLLASLLLDYDWMQKLKPRDQRLLLHLFFINGADFNRIPKPDYLLPRISMYYSKIGWKELPLVLAFYKNYNIGVLMNIMDFMNSKTINLVWAKLECFKTMENQHSLWSILKHDTVRSLCHVCKLVIVSSLGVQASCKINKLFLPQLLKEYLVSNVF